MDRSNFSLRILPSLLKAAQRIAESENCSVNQLINVALAEKIAVMDADRMTERKRRMKVSSAWKNLPAEEPLQKGDEVPASFKKAKLSKVPIHTVRD